MKKTQVEQESRVIVGAHGVAAEEDHLVLGKVIRVGVIGLFIFAVGAVWAWRVQVHTEQELQPDGPPPKPAALGQFEIGIVNQRLFDQDTHGREKLEEQHEALKNGWGDKPGVAAHMPIDQAMERVISDAQRPPPPPPPPAPEPAPGKAPAPGKTPAAPQGKAPAPTDGKAPAAAPAEGKAPAPAPSKAPATPAPAAPAPTPAQH